MISEKIKAGKNSYFAKSKHEIFEQEPQSLSTYLTFLSHWILKPLSFTPLEARYIFTLRAKSVQLFLGCD